MYISIFEFWTFSFFTINKSSFMQFSKMDQDFIFFSLESLCFVIVSYGVIPVPEVTDWQPLTGNDSYLVAATDGVFEKLTTQDICDILWDVHMHGNGKSEFCSTGAQSLADCIVNTAFAKGSMDNIAAVVVPLRSSGVPGTVQNERCDLERVHSSASELPNLIHLKSGTLSFFMIPLAIYEKVHA